MHRIVILGGGTGGTLTANRLRKAYGLGEASITVVDQNDRHVYQPGLLFVPFGSPTPTTSFAPGAANSTAASTTTPPRWSDVDLDARPCTWRIRSELAYDVLVVATGAVLAPEETEGLTGPGWMEKVFTFYTLEGRRQARRRR